MRSTKSAEGWVVDSVGLDAVETPGCCEEAEEVIGLDDNVVRGEESVCRCGNANGIVPNVVDNQRFRLVISDAERTRGGSTAWDGWRR